MELQQSAIYAEYIRSLGWIVEQIEDQYIYIKKLPFIRAIVKIQRVKKLPSITKLLPILRRNNVGTLAIEPDCKIRDSTLTEWLSKIPSDIKINTDYFLPTKTIRINLTPRLDMIFHSFSEAKRRAVRRAIKNGISIYESNDIYTFIHIKSIAAGFLGSITTFGLDKLWPLFFPKNASILLATTPSGKIVGGILLLYWNHLAYYWVAGATREGKKLFAPTLLIWKALELAKSKNCTDLDFVGIWDTRLPTQNRQWLGFTKFKEGFGGYDVIYPLSIPLGHTTE